MRGSPHRAEPLTFAEFPHGSARYRQACALRHDVLRAPLGLSLWDEDLAAEADQRHFGLFPASGPPVACAVVVPLSPTAVKIRQMAVRADCQRRGCGRALMTALLARLEAEGVRHVSLHARVAVAGFYAALGFSRSGGEFPEVGIPHVRMALALPQGPP